MPTSGGSPLEAHLAIAAREIAAPLVAAADSTQAFEAFLQQLGWRTSAIDGLAEALGPLTRCVSALQAVNTQLPQSSADSLAMLQALTTLGTELGAFAQALERVRFPSATAAEAAALAGALASDVMASLTSDWLRRRWPLPRLALVALGVLDRRPLPPLRAGSALVREASVSEQFDFEQLGRWLTDPPAALRALGQRHGTSGSSGARFAEEAWNVFGPLLPDALQAARLTSVWLPAEAARSVPGSLWIFTDAERLGGLGATQTAAAASGDSDAADAWVVLALEAIGSSIEFHVVPGGRWHLDRLSDRWRAQLQASSTGAVSFTGSGVRAQGGATLSASLATRTTPSLRLGPVDGPALQVGGLAVGVSGTMQDAQPWTLELSCAVTGVAVQIGASGGDGFLAKVLPSLSLPPVDLDLRWSPQGGLRLAAGTRASPVLLVRSLTLGPLEVRELGLSAEASASGVALSVASVVRLAVGPVHCTVTGLGLRVGLDAMPGAAGFAALHAGIQPPSGVGIKIDAGPVSGGGDLFFDQAEEQYGGIVQLSIKKKIALNAIALITTRLPGLPPGQKGFSLLLIITAEFPPLPLGFGFTLNGIGGLIGINRTMMLEPLRNSVRDRSIEGILFPQDPLANATSLVASLQRIFPPAEGRYVFGPMVKVGWGPTQLIMIEAALILELPSPLRLVLLGRMRAVLPDKTAPVVDLRLDVVGVLDFDRGEASIDASFVDSRLAGFTLTGDMALRLGWGATKAFALAAGGFNPRYAPPAGFPVLRRLALSLANSENPRFRLESYLALTSNTIQFGARAEISAKVQTAIGEFGAAAMIFFDALIELDPFGFIVDLGALIEVTLSGRPLIQAQLMATLSGTKPWHAVGFVEVVFLGRHRIPFEARVGDQAPTTLPTIDLMAKLTEEIRRPESWPTVPPADAADVVVLRDSSASGAALLHPLGNVALRQRLLPFGKRLARFGSAAPEGGAVMFALREIAVGGRTDSVTPLLDDFAPGQYEDLRADEKLSRPAFERMQSGGEATATPTVRLPVANPGKTAPGTQASIDYEEVVIDRLIRPSRPTRRRKKPVLAIGLIAAMADDGVAGDLEFAGPGDRAITVPGERWREADADHLGALPGARAGSAAEAHDRRALSRRPADQTTVIAFHEVA